ncbi:MAG: prepilin-type N-terminal cleavage/methylation domain-containing protein [Puniceicoccales bacterium]|nr:prepilin-type N-terminal cleavage/methylation domain-containing protein [Puniceicoccales bacterium]
MVKKKRGFSLLEMLVTAGIAGIFFLSVLWVLREFVISGAMATMGQNNALQMESTLMYAQLNKKISAKNFLEDCPLEEFLTWQESMKARIANMAVNNSKYEVVNFYLKDVPSFITMNSWGKWSFGEPYSICIRIPRDPKEQKQGVEMYFESFSEIFKDKQGSGRYLPKDTGHYIKFDDVKDVYFRVVWTPKYGEKKLDFLMDADVGLKLRRGHRRNAEGIASWIISGIGYRLDTDNLKKVEKLKKDGLIEKIYLVVER